MHFCDNLLFVLNKHFVFDFGTVSFSKDKSNFLDFSNLDVISAAHCPFASRWIPLTKCHFQEAKFWPSYTDTCRRPVEMGSKSKFHTKCFCGTMDDFQEGLDEGVDLGGHLPWERSKTRARGSKQKQSKQRADWEFLVLKLTTIILWKTVVVGKRYWTIWNAKMLLTTYLGVPSINKFYKFYP